MMDELLDKYSFEDIIEAYNHAAERNMNFYEFASKKSGYRGFKYYLEEVVLFLKYKRTDELYYNDTDQDKFL